MDTKNRSIAALQETPFSEWFRIENEKIVEGILMYDTHYIRSALAKAGTA